MVNFHEGEGWDQVSTLVKEHPQEALCMSGKAKSKGKPWCPLVTRKAPLAPEQPAMRPSGEQALPSPGPVISAEPPRRGQPRQPDLKRRAKTVKIDAKAK